MSVEVTLNPFSAAGARGRNDCYGRDHLLQNLYKQVAIRHEYRIVNLTGLRYIGKSTVLCCLADPDCFDLSTTGEATGIYPQDRVLFVYLDLKDEVTAIDPFLAIANAMYDRLVRRTDVNLHGIATEIALGKNGSGLAEDKLTNRLRLLPIEAERQGFRFVICLDHLDKSELLLDGARMQRLEPIAARASLIIATRKRLSSATPGLAGSPMVPRMRVVQVRSLSQEAADQLLDMPTAGETFRFSEDDRQLLITFVGRHPLLLWHAAEQAYEIVAESAKTRELGLPENDVRARIEPDLSLVFDKYWDDYGTDLARFHRLQFDRSLEPLGESLKNERRAIRQQLQPVDLIYEVRGSDRKFNYFSPLFESYVIAKIGAVVMLEPQAEPPVSAKRMDLDKMLALLGLQANSNEAEILSRLVKSAGLPLSKELLSEGVWGDKTDGRGLVTTINRLRNKMRKHAGEIPGNIKTHHSRGYSFEWLDPEV